MHSAISAMIDVTGGVDQFIDGATASVLGITSLQMGAFGGIIVGLGTSALHNRFYKIQLPQALSFFGGSRFVPIISTVVFAFVGIAMFFVWQPVQQGINALGYAVSSAGPGGRFPLWHDQAPAHPVWPAPCLLSAVLADRRRRFHGG